MNTHILNPAGRNGPHRESAGVNRADPDCNEFTPVLTWLARHPGPWLVAVWGPLLLVLPVALAAAGGQAVQVAVLLLVGGAYAGAAVAAFSASAPRWLPAVLLAGQTALTFVVLRGAAWTAERAGQGPGSTAAPWLPGPGLFGPAVLGACMVLALLAVGAATALPRAWSPAAIITVAINGGILVGTDVGAASGPAGAGPAVGLAAGTACFLAGLLAWLVRYVLALVNELMATRERLAGAAVAEERRRFSRDLHDLLGHTLSVIVVKGELIRRLAPLDPDAAARHAADVQAIGRQALAEVREAVSGYRGQGLAAELESARAALEAADVSVGISDSTVPQDMDDAGSAFLAWVVREGTTNVLRHARAGHCQISLFRTGEDVRLDLVDDGLAGVAMRAGDAAFHAGTWPAPGGHDLQAGGSGLRGLRERAAGVGGEMVASATASGFRLSATVPSAESRAVLRSRQPGT